MIDDIRKEQAWLITISLAAVALVAVGFILVYTRGVLIPFVIALLFTCIVTPFVDFQVRRLGFPRVVAIVGALLLFLLVTSGLVLFLIHGAQNVVRSVGEYAGDFAQLGTDLLAQLAAWNIHIDATETVKKMQGEIPRIATNLIGSGTGIVSQAT